MLCCVLTGNSPATVMTEYISFKSGTSLTPSPLTNNTKCGHRSLSLRQALNSGRHLVTAEQPRKPNRLPNRHKDAADNGKPIMLLGHKSVGLNIGTD